MINFATNTADCLLVLIEQNLDSAKTMHDMARAQNMRSLTVGIIIGVYALKKISKRQYEEMQRYCLTEFDIVISAIK